MKTSKHWALLRKDLSIKHVPIDKVRCKARFLVDECVDQRFAQLLKGFGHCAYTAREAGLVGHPDENYFAYAKSKKLIIVTHNDDFWDDRLFPLMQFTGIILLPSPSETFTPLLEAFVLIELIVCKSPDFWRTFKLKIEQDDNCMFFTFKYQDSVLGMIKERIRLTTDGQKWILRG